MNDEFTTKLLSVMAMENPYVKIIFATLVAKKEVELFDLWLKMYSYTHFASMQQRARIEAEGQGYNDYFGVGEELFRLSISKLIDYELINGSFDEHEVVSAKVYVATAAGYFLGTNEFRAAEKAAA